jgi:hypothetical protein
LSSKSQSVEFPADDQRDNGRDIPEIPKQVNPSGNPERVRLWNDVRDALNVLPSYFKSDLTVSGVLATDLFTFNASLGATIEQQVVTQLNQLRSAWGPKEKHALYRFERQSQRFPDVVLRSTSPGVDPTPLLGIELKGWYALAREGEPSFRYEVTPEVCSEFDLLVVFPWALSNVISGSPILFEPYIAGARYAAEYRNWHWRYHIGGSGKGAESIDVSAVKHSYPSKSDPISDQAVSDKGKNFGRFARTELMDDYIRQLFTKELSGIPLSAWQRFFRVFTETDTEENLDRLIAQMARKRTKKDPKVTRETADQIMSNLLDIAELMKQ